MKLVSQDRGESEAIEGMLTVYCIMEKWPDSVEEALRIPIIGARKPICEPRWLRVIGHKDS